MITADQARKNTTDFALAEKLLASISKMISDASLKGKSEIFIGVEKNRQSDRACQLLRERGFKVEANVKSIEKGGKIPVELTIRW